MRTPAAVLLATALLAGCGGGDDSPDPVHTGGGGVLLYERGGGIAASEVSLVIDAGGDAVLTTGIPGDRHRAKFEVDPGRNSELRELAVDADLPALAKQGPEPVVCADCYVYGIAFGGVEVQRVEVAVPESLDELIAGLQEIVDEQSAQG